MNKIKVDVKQASEFMTAGYEVECYVIMPKVLPGKGKEFRAPFIPTDAKLRLSLEHEGPVKGVYRLAWNQLKDKLWANGDLSETHTRGEVEDVIKNFNSKIDAGFFTYLVNQKKCLRVVE